MKTGERGQITIPKVLREKYGLFPDVEVEIIEEKKGIKLQKKNPHLSPIKQVFGILGKSGNTDEFMEEIRGR